MLALTLGQKRPHLVASGLLYLVNAPVRMAFGRHGVHNLGQIAGIYVSIHDYYVGCYSTGRPYSTGYTVSYITVMWLDTDCN